MAGDSSQLGGRGDAGLLPRRRVRALRVDVPAGYVHWVPPGACYNRVGYFEVPDSRVVYRQGGQTRSFGIASVWYVVHLGAVVRASDAGVVDDPSNGSGVSAPSASC